MKTRDWQDQKENRERDLNLKAGDRVIEAAKGQAK